MAWIGGIFSKANMNHDELAKKLAVMMEAACPTDQPWAVAHPPCISSILDDSNGQALAKVFINTEGTKPEPVYADYRQNAALIYDGHLYSFKSPGSRPSRAHHVANEISAAALARSLAGVPGNLEQKVRNALTGLDGDYALALSNTDQIAISRNCLGTKPLYFAENNEFSAFASNKKPLWKTGLDEVRPLRTGMVAVLGPEEIRVRKGLPFRKAEIEIKSMAEAVRKYEQVLHLAVLKRLATMNHVHKVGVLLSGGVDSCLIAKWLRDVASGPGMEAVAYSVGLRGSPDMNFAREFAEELGMKQKMKILSIDAAEEYIPKVIEATEDSDFVQVETGIGLYAAIDMASQDGISVLFSGQGPDELWGGYSWYPRVLGKDGRQELCHRMSDDFSRADIETLDRENKIAMAHGVELFFPYLDSEVANAAMSVASELKVTSEEDHLGKHPHRRLAIKMGVPEKYANREKLAIQHGTGVHSLLDEIARKNGFNPAMVSRIGYENEGITKEKLASSTRYGYRYLDKRLWQAPQHIQFFLHSVACRQGLLNRSVRDRVGYFLGKATQCSRVSL